MDHPEPINYEILGSVTWDATHRWWFFEAGPIAGRPIPGKIIPDDGCLALNEQWLAPIRASVCWIRDNEAVIRDRISERMFDWWKKVWYDEEIDEITTREGFRDAITLCGVSFYEAHKPELYYEDHNLVGGHCITVTLGPEGSFASGPEVFG